MTDGPDGNNSEADPKAAAGSIGTVEAPSIFESDDVVTAALAQQEGFADGGAGGAVPPPEGIVDAGGPNATAALIDVACGLQELGSKQEELRALFEARIRSDEVQAKALERLSDQLRDYKTNFIRQEMQPLLRDLIYCYDFAADEADRAGREGPPPTIQEIGHAFNHLKQMVADVLAKYDVEPYRAAGPDFDRREQQCVRTVPTANEADEKKVAVVGAIGFRLAEQVIRKEQVTVYKYTPGAPSRD
jgi:molecular chaperone GrpE (heat shock protein)